MPTLTTAQIEDIRDVIGDQQDQLTDSKIQTQYDNAGSDLVLTYVYCLRRLWGLQRRNADRTTDHGDNDLQSQVVANTKALLDYWEGQAGLFGASLNFGLIDLGLDDDDTSAGGV